MHRVRGRASKLLAIAVASSRFVAPSSPTTTTTLNLNCMWLVSHVVRPLTLLVSAVLVQLVALKRVALYKLKWSRNAKV